VTSFPVRRWVLAAGSLLLSACASGTTATGTGPAGTPAPEPGEEAPTPAPPPGGKGPAVSYQPIAGAAYRMERHDSLDLQFEGGATQQQVRDRTAFLRVTLAQAPAAGSYGVTIELDSLVAVESGSPVDPDSLRAVTGTRWTATLSEDGALSGLQADRKSVLGDELQGRLRLLFPALPPGGVRRGMEWTDTTRYELVADAFPGIETAVMTYRAEEGESSSEQSIALASSGSYTRAGTRMQADQPLEMTASGKREGVHLLGLDGVLQSAEGHDSGEMTISVPALGQTVPVKQTGSYRITATPPPSR
jgi:hypothetical protein